MVSISLYLDVFIFSPQKLEVTFGERTDSLSLAQNELLLNLSENAMQIALGDKVVTELRDDTHNWLNIWDDGMLLAFGGVPGEQFLKPKNLLVQRGLSSTLAHWFGLFSYTSGIQFRV